MLKSRNHIVKRMSNILDNNVIIYGLIEKSDFKNLRNTFIDKWTILVIMILHKLTIYIIRNMILAIDNLLWMRHRKCIFPINLISIKLPLWMKIRRHEIEYWYVSCFISCSWSGHNVQLFEVFHIIGIIHV